MRDAKWDNNVQWRRRLVRKDTNVGAGRPLLLLLLLLLLTGNQNCQWSEKQKSLSAVEYNSKCEIKLYLRSVFEYYIASLQFPMATSLKIHRIVFFFFLSFFFRKETVILREER